MRDLLGILRRADGRIDRAILVLLLFVGPLLYLSKQAFFDPKIEFLVPSVRGGWALHPVQQVLSFQDGRVSKDVEFARDFALEALPARMTLRARAFTEMTVRLNGAEVPPRRRPSNWKRPSEFDLAPFLRVGENRLRIRVHNPGAVPALLVESPKQLRTPEGWTAALEPEFADFRPVVRPFEREPKPGPLQAWPGWNWVRPLVIVWLIAVGVALLAGIGLALRRREEAARPVAVPKALRIGVPLLIFAIALALNLYNTAVYPYTRAAFDWKGHVEYVERIAETWRPPIATDGWEMFQPPFYYYVAAVVYRLFGWLGRESTLKAVQYLGALVGFGLVVLAWLYARLFFPKDPPAQWAATAFAAFLPMRLYMNPLITNEVFAGTVIAAAAYLLLAVGARRNVSIRSTALVGVAVGLGFLSKFTGLFTFLAGCVLYGLGVRRDPAPRAWGRVGVYVVAVLLVSGWFYIRNAIRFDDPFIGNWDEASGFHYEQNPGYRTVGFYLRFGSVFFHHPERARWMSWLDGNFASMWSDGHGNFFVQDAPGVWFPMGVLLLFAAPPTAAIVLGLVATLAAAFRDPARSRDVVLAAIPIWTWASLISFTMEVPMFSTVKAFFFLSIVPILGVYLARGRRLLDRWRIARLVLDGSIVASSILSIWVFRYRP